MSSYISEAINASSGTSSASSKSKSGLGVDSETFLKLLVAQLQYQDPLEPQSDTEFVTQLAQMTSLDEMQQLNSSFSSVQAYSLVGKLAYAETVDGDTGETSCHYGTVGSILCNGGTYYAVIGSDLVDIGDILQVSDPDILSGGSTVVEASGLIGKTISGAYIDSDGSTKEITGTVTSVKSVGGVICAYIGDTAVAVSDITSIG